MARSMNNTALAETNRIRVSYLEDLTVYQELEEIGIKFRLPVSTILRMATLEYVEKHGKSGTISLPQARPAPLKAKAPARKKAGKR